MVSSSTTACKWDTVIPFDKLWEQYERIIKDNGAIVLTASQPFTSALVMSNLKMFREDIVWEKHKPSNFACGKTRHLKYHESILVFSKHRHTFNPQMQPRKDNRVKSGIENNNKVRRTISDENNVSFSTNYPSEDYSKYDPDLKLPGTILKIPAVVSTSKEKVKHPTQKPVALFEYLIRTYTNEGDLVLDNCIGSGTTAVAARNTNRNFIGFELDEGYYRIAMERLSCAQS